VNTIALYNIKGGVGKTASVVNLAYLSNQEGKHTLVWDLDPQAASTFYFRIRPKLKGGRKALLKKKASSHLAEQIRGTDFEGLDLLPASFSLRKLDITLDEARKPEKPLRRILGTLAKEYDQIFLDCAPGISVASEAIFEVADVLLVPTIPTPLSLRTLERLGQHLRRKGPKRLRVIPFLSMVDRRKQMHREIAQQLAEKCAGLPRVEAPLRSHIPYSSLVERMGTERAPLFTYTRASSAPAKAYCGLWQELQLRLGMS
jgi:cellulose biosynthesis protein BcsQ